MPAHAQHILVIPTPDFDHAPCASEQSRRPPARSQVEFALPHPAVLFLPWLHGLRTLALASPLEFAHVLGRFGCVRAELRAMVCGIR